MLFITWHLLLPPAFLSAYFSTSVTCCPHIWASFALPLNDETLILSAYWFPASVLQNRTPISPPVWCVQSPPSGQQLTATATATSSLPQAPSMHSPAGLVEPAQGATTQFCDLDSLYTAYKFFDLPISFLICTAVCFIGWWQGFNGTMWIT